jgi:hypothetical protein
LPAQQAILAKTTKKAVIIATMAMNFSGLFAFGLFWREKYMIGFRRKIMWSFVAGCNSKDSRNEENGFDSTPKVFPV